MAREQKVTLFAPLLKNKGTSSHQTQKSRLHERARFHRGFAPFCQEWVG